MAAPSAFIRGPAAAPVAGEFGITIRFSEAVEGLELADLAVDRGEAHTLAGRDVGRAGMVRPHRPRPRRRRGAVGEPAARRGDRRGGNPGKPYRFEIAADRRGPRVVIGSESAEPANGAFIVTFAFDEPVSGFEAGDVLADHGTPSAPARTADPLVWASSVTPAAGYSGVVTVGVAAGAVADAAGNGNAASDRLEFAVDAAPPTVAIGEASPGRCASRSTWPSTSASR